MSRDRWLIQFSLLFPLMLSANGYASFGAIISLTNDAAKTHAAAFGTTKEGPLNDLFAYDPSNPGAALPHQDYSTSPPDLWHSPNGVQGTDYAVLFDQPYVDIFVDYYARTDDPGAHNRDDNLTVEFYNGDWIDPVHIANGFFIDNTIATSNRLTIPNLIEADRFLITNAATNWSISELRANGTAVIPEPGSTVAMILVSPLCFFQRRRRAT